MEVVTTNSVRARSRPVRLTVAPKGDDTSRNVPDIVERIGTLNDREVDEQAPEGEELETFNRRD